MAAAATRAHAVRATDGGAEQRLRGARDGRRGGAPTAPAVAAPSVPETCALVQGACQEGGKRGGAGRAAAAASSRALRAQWGGRARAQRVTGQGSSPHPAVAFERRLSHACAGAAGRSAVGRDGAVPAAGRVQGAGAESPAHSAPAEAADRVESFSWPRGPHLCGKSSVGAFCLGVPHDGVGRVGLGPPVGFFPLFTPEFSQQKKKFSAEMTMSTLPKWVIWCLEGLRVACHVTRRTVVAGEYHQPSL